MVQTGGVDCLGDKHIDLYKPERVASGLVDERILLKDGASVMVVADYDEMDT